MANQTLVIQMHCQNILNEANKLCFAYSGRTILQHMPEAVKLWEEQYRAYCEQFGMTEAENWEMEGEIELVKDTISQMFQFPANYIK